MPRPSSAKYVSYDLRPSKQRERKLMLDVLNVALKCGLDIPNYRYVGMGANRFYDFIQMFRSFGIRNMVSLEHDDKMFERAVFNCPYNFIRVLKKSCNEFLQEDTFTGSTIFWMDYDGTINEEVIQDIASSGAKVKGGDLLFFTVSCEPPGWLRKLNGKRRVAELRSRFLDMASEVTLEDVQDQQFPETVNKIEGAAVQNAFAMRQEGEFRMLFKVKYADGARMITFGGVFHDAEECGTLVKRLEQSMPFVINAVSWGTKFRNST